MRGVQNGDVPVDVEFVDFMETCVQCRGCEPACPSNVEFGALMEQTRTTLAIERRITPWWQRLGFRVLRHHRLLLAGFLIAGRCAAGQISAVAAGSFGVAGSSSPGALLDGQ